MINIVNTLGYECNEKKFIEDVNYCKLELDTIIKEYAKSGLVLTDGVNIIKKAILHSNDSYTIIYERLGKIHVIEGIDISVDSINPIFTLVINDYEKLKHWNGDTYIFVSKPYYGKRAVKFNYNKPSGSIFMWSDDESKYVIRKYWKLQPDLYYISGYGEYRKSFMEKQVYVKGS